MVALRCCFFRHELGSPNNVSRCRDANNVRERVPSEYAVGALFGVEQDDDVAGVGQGDDGLDDAAVDGPG